MLRSGFVIALALASWLPTSAVAGPLPDPPFTGGFVSPSATVLLQQKAIQKLIDKYIAGNDACDRKTLIALHSAYPPAGAGDPVTLQKIRDGWANCTARVSIKVYFEGVDKVVESGPPACLGEAAIQDILAGAEGVRRYVRDFSYCDGDAANPDPTTQLKIPDSPVELLAELKLHKPMIQAGTRVGHCYAKAAAKTFANGGTLSADDLDRLSACANKAIGKGQLAVQRIADKLALPACVSVPNLQLQISGAPSTAVGIATLVYCAP